VFRVVGEAFAALPTLQSVLCSGFSQRVDTATGKTSDDYLLSVRVAREVWLLIDFGNLAQVDPAAALARFELRSDCTAPHRGGPRRSCRSRGSAGGGFGTRVRASGSAQPLHHVQVRDVAQERISVP